MVRATLLVFDENIGQLGTLYYQIVVAPRLFILRKIVDHYELNRYTTIIEIGYGPKFSVHYYSWHFKIR